MDTRIVGTDRGKAGASSGSLRASSTAAFDPSPAYGESVTFRKAIVISRGVKLNFVPLPNHESSEVRIGLAGFTTKSRP